MIKLKNLIPIAIIFIVLSLSFTQITYSHPKILNRKEKYNFSSNGPLDSHQQFARQALKILAKDKGKNFSKFYSKYKTIMLKYCDKPDIDENDFGFAYHFFNPYTNRNFLPSFMEASKVTGLTKFKQHITKAIEEYTLDRKNAMKELGRATHFLEDINVPHHAANLIGGVSSHTEYESYVSKSNKLFFINSTKAYKKYSDKSFDEFCTDIFEECAKNSYSYKDIANSMDENNWKKASIPTIKLAQEDMATLFYRFELEVK